jgi:pimeloyl-ACP methyl ester carboxylesterase
MATFVLVHGGWDGGWCWKEVEPYLRAAGHEVLRPSLTGCGDRVHLRHPGVTLDTHVQDIVSLLAYEGGGAAVLVGWSYGGMVITGVAERAPERLAHLVYLDAFVPQDGQALFDLLDPDFRAELEAQARAGGDGWRVPPAVDPPDGRPRTDLLLPPCRQPLALTNPAAARLPRTYIQCTADVFLAHFPEAAARARQAGWRVRELPAGHTALWTMPKETADMLLEVV